MTVELDQLLTAAHQEAVSSLSEWLRIPSISTVPAHAGDVRRAAQWIADYLERAGIASQVWRTSGHPAVFARMPASPDAPTVLIYGHFDVQPTGDLSRWTTPPFEPAIRDGRLFARGVADDKGQFFAHVLACAAWKRVGNCPVNVKLLCEGEEEIGSPNLAELLQQRKKELACDVVVVSDSPLWKPARPAISLGTRGITGLEILVTGPNRDLHSGIFGGSVPNPIAVLCRMLAHLHDPEQRVAVPGFYDRVKPTPPDLRDQWKILSDEVASDAQTLGAPLVGEEGCSTLERRWLRPTLEFNGITGGYQGEGSNTIVPGVASAKITCRLVPDQDPDEIQSLVVQHLKSIAPSYVKPEFILRKLGAPAYSIDPDHRGLQAAARAMAD
ncbi:MAG: M20/M25/M40 family metallo-hydrolase, partial [Tepidisphaeraceae bacterium]